MCPVIGASEAHPASVVQMSLLAMFTNVSIIIAANMNAAWPTFSLEIQSLKGCCGSKERAEPRATLKPCRTPGLWKRPLHSVLSQTRVVEASL